MSTCSRCGEKFEKELAAQEFESETLKSYDYLTSELCANCAIEAMNSEESGVYKEICENCGKHFDPFDDESEFNDFTRNDSGAYFSMFNKFLCADCAIEEYENFTNDEDEY